MTTYLNFRQQVIDNKITCEEETRNILKRIGDNKHLNAYISINENAIQEAIISDDYFKKGKPRQLEGMLIAIKDNISTGFLPTTCASKMLADYQPIYNATVVDKIKSEGGIVIGKANMDEFAMGSSNETSFFGSVKHPIDTSYVPGGSSGGSTAIVAAGLAHTALGSDTGGSVRQPAAFCGTVGFKPTYGRISRYGLIAFASSLDHIGIVSANLEDNALLLDVISGVDEFDSTTSELPNTTTFQSIQQNTLLENNFKVGILSKEILKTCSKDVLDNYEQCLSKMEKHGGKFHELNFDDYESWVPTYIAITTAEASSNFARLDGIRFGYQSNKNIDDTDFISLNRGEAFNEEVKRRLLVGTQILLSNTTHHYYSKAQFVRKLIKKCYADAFKQVDLIFWPTTTTAAFKSNEKNNDPVAMYLSDFFTTSANLSGVPAISLPVGKGENGMPIGMQIQTNLFEEEKLFQYSKYIFN